MPSLDPRRDGDSLADYEAPLFLAWQLTNRCMARCLACCEESGPERAWPDELSAAQALQLARGIVASDIPYVAFGGGEPLGVPHCWTLFQELTAGGVAIKLETDGSHIDEHAAARLAELAVPCVQISVDGACAMTHERCRPGSSYAAALGAIERLVARARPPQWVFAPNRLNLHELLPAYDLAARLGCDAFVTGPLMRLGRAAADWQRLACDPADWEERITALREHAQASGYPLRLAVYPWDILEELRQRLAHPQAMLLVVPNGRVKLLNALPFSVADLRHDSLDDAWRAYRAGWQRAEVRAFVLACRERPELLRHANAIWPLEGAPALAG